MATVTPFLWFDGGAEEALSLYTQVFEGSDVVEVSRVPMPDGGTPLMIGTIRIGGIEVVLFNGPPATFRFNESISLVVGCADQEEVDHYWYGLSDGGEPGQCGWLKDRFGVSWQVVPTILGELMGDPDPAKAGRVSEALMKMNRIECALLQQAYDG